MMPNLPRRMPAAAISVMLCMFLAGSARSQPSASIVVGYYPDWSRASYSHTAIAYEHLTHIAHSFVIPAADGSLSGTAGFAYPELVQAAHQAGVKVILVLGGWDQSAGFPPMAADSAARRRFIANLVSFCVANSYDGVDLDWEYPANSTDRGNLTTLVREMRIAFSAAPRLLSISLAVPSTNWTGQWFDIAGMKDHVDWFGIMTYDYYGAWTSKAGPNSALYGSFVTNSEGWIDYSWSYYTATRGAAPQKLLIGIPFYGQVFNAAGMYAPSTGAQQSTYAMIASYVNPEWTRYWDNEGKVPYLVNSTGTKTVSFDDTVSVRLKCEYARAKTAGGVMIWAIGQDQVTGQTPLLRTIGSVMKPATSVPAGGAPGVPSVCTLGQNYPNPFNPSTRISVSLVERQWTILTVYDVLGRMVATLMDEMKEPGTYTVSWDATGLASGVYQYRIMAGPFVETKMMVLLR